MLPRVVTLLSSLLLLFAIVVGDVVVVVVVVVLVLVFFYTLHFISLSNLTRSFFFSRDTADTPALSSPFRRSARLLSSNTPKLFHN